MIPKVGDILKINPVFKEAYCAYVGQKTSKFGEKEDGFWHVSAVEEAYVNGFRVPGFHVFQGYYTSYRIDRQGRPADYVDILVKWGLPPDTPLFLPVTPEKDYGDDDDEISELTPGQKL
jgi:hypothetical protein